MKSPAAVLFEIGEPWRVEEVDVAAPLAGEVTVELVATGLCHSDDHARTGDIPVPMPSVGGHEGAGIVIDTGEGVSRTKVGDHVVLFPGSVCGTCRFCNDGRSYLCDANAHIMTGHAPDGHYRFHFKGQPVGAFSQLGTFSRVVTVSELNIVPVDEDVPLDVACLLGCGVITGYGAAVNAGQVRAGQVVVVVGAGGVGMNAVQGARLAGAALVIAVDPVAFKRQKALEFGATHVAASIEEARELVSELTRNVMADKVLVTLGVLKGSMFPAFAELTAKGGAMVVTSASPTSEHSLDIPLTPYFLWGRAIIGNVMGLINPLSDIPALLTQYRQGHLKLDELVTTTYKLDDINQAYEDMYAGKNIRGLIRY